MFFLRILTNLEHLERKYSLNRSLSLNYKSHRSNNECCCNANKSDKSRLSLTKDEKTDKNIKRRQLYDTTNTNSAQSPGNASGNAKYRRHSSIRRRHTVGGTHDYPSIIIRTDRDLVDWRRYYHTLTVNSTLLHRNAFFVFVNLFFWMKSSLFSLKQLNEINYWNSSNMKRLCCKKFY